MEVGPRGDETSPDRIESRTSQSYGLNNTLDLTEPLSFSKHLSDKSDGVNMGHRTLKRHTKAVNTCTPPPKFNQGGALKMSRTGIRHFLYKSGSGYCRLPKNLQIWKPWGIVLGIVLDSCPISRFEVPISLYLQPG